jgi:hypothetical protein
MHKPLLPLAVLLAFAGAAHAADPGATLDLAGATIRQARNATDLERFAAREIARYFRLLTATGSAVQPLDDTGTGSAGGATVEVVIGTPDSLPALKSQIPDSLGEDGYVLRVVPGKPVRLLVAGREPAGVQRGAYALVERLGVGFYLGGDALPEPRPALLIPADLDETRQPVFRIRGSLPWYNFLNSPTTWDLEDFQVFFDQMAKMGNNFVGFHSYDSEPFAAYPWEGNWRMGAPAATSLDYGWGTVRGLKSDAFGFGTGRYFSYEVFGSRSAALRAEPPQDSVGPWVFPRRTPADEAILRAQAGLAQGLEYARRRGLHVCVGFELTGDPTVAETRRQTEARIRNLLATYPMMDHVWFWQSEGLGGGAAAAPLDSPLGAIVHRLRPTFAYLASEERIGEAARVAAWVEFAHGVVKRLRPDLKVVVSGWGGDAWMRFSDFYVGLDQVLPRDIVFAALDNIDPTAQAQVSEAYGKLSPGREKWPIPWFESDGGGSRRDQWFAQANVKPFTHLVRDARAKGCQGLLGIHWQTRGIEEVAAYTAQYAWNPDLTYADFYADFARKCFGETHGPEMASVLVRLEALGPRWTGASGQIECGGFQWFSDDRRPRDENFQALAEIDATLGRLAAACAEGPGQRHAERLRYLRASVAFARRFDRAALELSDGGRIATLVQEAENAKRQGQAGEATRRAREALEAMTLTPLGPAMEHYTARLTSQGDFGNLATINVKAYAAFLGLWERAQAALGERRPLPGPSLKTNRPELIVKLPPSALPEGAPFKVRAIAFSQHPLRELQLKYRAPGGPWVARPLQLAGRHLFEADLPAEAVGAAGVEYHVVAVDDRGVTAVAPVGFPEVVYSASALPFPGPAAYGPWLHRGWAGAPWRPQAQADPPAFLRSVVIPAVEYEPCEWQLRLAGQERDGACAYHLGSIPIPATGPALELASWQARDGRGNVSQGNGTRFAPPPAPASPQAARAEVVEPFLVRVSWTGEASAGFEIHRAETPGFEPTAATLLAPWPWKTFDDHTPAPGKSYEYAVVALEETGPRSLPARSARVHVEDAPLPEAPANVRAIGGLGRVTLRWDPASGPVRGYSVSVIEAGAEKRVSGDLPVPRPEHTVVTESVAPRRYVVRAMDRAKRPGAPSEPVEAAALPVPHDPVFRTDFTGTKAATGQEGRLVGRAVLDEQCLDTRLGGWIAYPGEELLQAGAPLTVTLRVNVDRIEGIPVLISFGHWEGPGWWLQLIGGQLRFYLPVQKILDAGTLPVGGWHHLAATYDGTTSRLFVDGVEVGHQEIGPVDPRPWPGELRIGMYSDDAAMYQSAARIDDVKIWRRALSAAEIRALQQ